MLIKLVAGILSVAALGVGTFAYVHHSGDGCPLANLLNSESEATCCKSAASAEVSTCCESKATVRTEAPSCCELVETPSGKAEGEVIAIAPREVK